MNTLAGNLVSPVARKYPLDDFFVFKGVIIQRHLFIRCNRKHQWNRQLGFNTYSWPFRYQTRRPACLRNYHSPFHRNNSVLRKIDNRKKNSHPWKLNVRPGSQSREGKMYTSQWQARRNWTNWEQRVWPTTCEYSETETRGKHNEVLLVISV